MLVLDIEIYRDYLLVAFMDSETRKVRHFEAYEGHPLDRRTVSSLMRNYQTVSFNGLGFDLPLLVLALAGGKVEAVKRMGDRIIVDRVPAWRLMRDMELTIPEAWDHIDLIDVAPGQSSLKIYGGRMHAPKLQDLPIEPDASISPEHREQLKVYCVNDLETTLALYHELKKPLSLRALMSEQYGMDLRSKSDAQIAETVIKSELTKISGKNYRPPRLAANYGFHYRDPGIIRFESDNLKDVYEAIKAHRFTLRESGNVEMPDWLKKTPVEVEGVPYQMGIGGLHSKEAKQHVACGPGEALYELDVSGYYPSIILQQRLAPASLGDDFLTVYQSIVDRRIKAKREGDKATSDTLKIAVNGSFGKLGSKYSALYSPDLLIQTTITGQLALLMLIERMRAIGATVVSANTDGIVLHHHKDLEADADRVAWDWMLDTSYTLERTDYLSISSRDVNNYVAVKPDESTKGKGVFASGGLMKNPDQTIVTRAVADHIAKGIDIEKTVMDSQDLREFVTVRQVKGGAVWRGIELGKAVRFYLSSSVAEDECIHYASNCNRVPKSAGARPVMDFPESCPSDIDRQAYIVAAERLLCEVGFA